MREVTGKLGHLIIGENMKNHLILKTLIYIRDATELVRLFLV